MVVTNKIKRTTTDTKSSCDGNGTTAVLHTAISHNLQDDDDNHTSAGSCTRMGDDTVDAIANDNDSLLPQHIKVYIEDVLLLSVAGTLLESSQQQQQQQLPLPLHITNVTTFRSAQQQIYLVQLGNRNSRQKNHNESLLLPSKNHETTDLPFPSTIESCQSSMLVDAIRKGNNYIVIKIWTGTSRWWNCHHMETTITKNRITNVPSIMEDEGISPKQNIHCTVDDQNGHNLHHQQQQHIAQQEMIGYRTAYEIFTYNIQNEFLAPTTNSSNISASGTIIRIPRVLYSSIMTDTSTYDPNIQCNCAWQPPWCILEYVGPYSNSVYDHHHWIQYDTSYIDAMIPTRMEYGFDESHLRWGRLPIDLCIQYTLELLNAFIIPLHIHYFTSVHQRSSSNKIQLLTDSMNVYSFDSMVELFKLKYTCHIEQNIHKMSENDEESKYATMLNDASQILKTAIDTIYNDEVVPFSIQNLPPVLCHMDLQPQNLMFATSSSSEMNSHQDDDIIPAMSSIKPNRCQFLSVLDWEEAAYADPRFELLLLCRKVCANREQAEYIWQYYSDRVNERLMHCESHHPIQLGCITPWLKLEAIHSIITMLLECVAGGGRGNGRTGLRNDHGTKVLNNDRSDNNAFFSKLQREMRRLNSLGYTFCKTDHWCFVEGNNLTLL